MKYLDNNSILIYFNLYLLINIPILQSIHLIKIINYLILSVFLKKSKDNLEAAKFLNNKKKIYTSVVHCAYYSSFQIFTHILYNELFRNEASIIAESKAFKDTIHNTKIKNVLKDISENNPDDAEKIMSEMGELQELRTDSDYKETEIGVLESFRAIALSESINNLLFKKYKFSYEH
jgi:hypothetical protein